MRVDPAGLGYRATLVDEGIEMAVDRLTESRGETSAELTVARTGEGQLLISRVNLSTFGTRSSVGKYLSARSNHVDWTQALETFFGEVLRRERSSSPVVSLSRVKPRGTPDWMLYPLLISGDPTILYGDGEAGKSTLAAAAAVTHATGHTIVPGWRSHATGNVLVLDWEADAGDWSNAVAGICAGAGIEQPDIFYRYCSLSLPAILHEVATEVGDRNISLVIIDSVGMATPGDREGASAEAGTLRLFGAIRRLGCAALLIDHVAKADLRNGGIAPGPYGSIYKRYRTRLAFELRAADRRKGDDWRHTALYHRKGNNVARMEAAGIGVLHDQGVIRFRDEEVADELSAGMSHGERITRHLLDEGRSTVREIADATGIDAKIVHVTVSRMGHIIKVGKEGKADLYGVKSNNSNSVGDAKSNKGSPLKGGEPLGVGRTDVGDDGDQRSFRDVLADANEERGEWDVD